MNINELFGVHEHALHLRSQRAEILASNLVNADTPHYKARDFDFKEVLSNLITEKNNLIATDPKHISDNNALSDFNLKYRIPLQASLDGNTVDEHVERGQFAENSIRYMASMKFIDQRIKNIMTAIRGE